MKRARQTLLMASVAVALIALWACGGQPSTPASPTAIPVPTLLPGAPPITDFTPVAGLSKNTEVRDRYFGAIYLWKVPPGRAYTQGDTFTPAETFTKADGKIGMRVEALDTFVPGMLVTYRVDGRSRRGEGEVVSLASTITKPGAYDVTFDVPTDTGSYVVRFFLNAILVENLLFEVQ